MPVAINSFQSWLIKKIITDLAGHELDAYVDGVYATEDDQTNDPVSVLRLQIRYTVTRTGLQDDFFENVLHFVNTAGELPGIPATDTQKAAVEAAWNSYWGLVKTKSPPEVNCTQYRWYHVTFDDPLSGPPTRVTTTTAGAGTSTGGQAPQTAVTLTMRTAMRKHWGRIYLPCGLNSNVGFQSNSDTDLFANNFRTFVNACDAADLNPVVYSKQNAAVYSISQVECDNVLDVVRRRRPKNSTYRKILTTST